MATLAGKCGFESGGQSTPKMGQFGSVRAENDAGTRRGELAELRPGIASDSHRKMPLVNGPFCEKHGLWGGIAATPPCDLLYYM